METIKLTCCNCDTKFDRYIGEHRRLVNKGKTRFFCSLKCAMVKLGDEKRSPSIEMTCKKCEKKFITENNSRKKIYCSEVCRHSANKEREQNRWKDHTPARVKRPRSKDWTQGRALTTESEMLRRQRVSDTCKKNNKTGGHRIGSGRGKKGWYKEIFCDSSWELAYVVFCKEHDISIKRNTVLYPYEWNGKTRKYIPDFIVGKESELVEIKGYETDQWKEKLKSVASIKVIGKNDIKKYIDYVEGKYGKNFISLYEKEDKSTEA